jgi:diguanylate cyclase (GGDEF)-like protein
VKLTAEASEPASARESASHAPAGPSDVPSSLLGRMGLARFESATEQAYLRQKFLETRPIAILMGFAASLLGVGLWVWDWVHDPAHVMEALPRRLVLGGILLLYPVALLLGLRRSLLPWFMAFIVLITQAVFLDHLDRLEGGLVYGIAGFMYWFLLPIFMGLPYRSGATLLIFLACALLPNLLVGWGMAPRFELDKFNALILPTCLVAIAMTWMLDQLYRRLFRYRKTIEEMARFDGLTGIDNRRYFMERANDVLSLCARHEQPLSVLMLDIDHFKQINDTHGHLVGDRVIRHVARLLRRHLRKTDLLCRYGGEEFALVLPATEPENARLVAEKIRRWIAESHGGTPESPALDVTVSVGVTGLDRLPREADLEELLQLADDALYRAKRAGRNRVVTIRQPEDAPEPQRRGRVTPPAA